jgi:hypothetical protein
MKNSPITEASHGVFVGKLHKKKTTNKNEKKDA